ncbi:MAG: hypothetical protein DHS20C15_15430 [Planctomycetota bacterium]|nr:MAG: hypothetical protein DHS20C15_15430 [Planctomycetota bacterium]
MPRTLTSLLALFVMIAMGGVWWMLDTGEGARGAPQAGSGAPLSELLPSTLAVLPTSDSVDAQPLDLSGSTSALPVADPIPETLAQLRADAWVSGRLVDPDGKPVANEPLLLLVERDAWWSEEAASMQSALRGAVAPGEVLSSASSDADGAFRLAARAGAQHTLRAGGRLAAPRRLRDVVSGVELLVVLEPGVSLAGQVISEVTGEPVPGAHVGVLAAAQHMLTQTDADGRFELAPLPSSEQLYGAWALGFGLLSGSLVPLDEERVFELPPARDVLGQVLERETNLPLEGARVRLTIDIEARLASAAKIEHETQALHEVEVLTDADGRFVIPESPARGFVIEAFAEAHLPSRSERYQSRSLRDDESIVLSLAAVEPRLARVFDAETGAAVEGASVELRGPEGLLFTDLTDAEGLAELDPSAWDGRGSLAYVARDERGYTARANRPRSSREARLELVEPAILRVQTTLHGAPLPHAEVAVLSHATTTLGRTDAEGLAELHHERAGPDDELVLQARHEGLQSVSVPVAWPLESSDPIELALDGGSYVTGFVLDEHGAPIVAAHVWGSFGPSDYTDGEGRFRVGPCDDDQSGRLYAEAEGYKRASLSSLWAGDTDIVLALEPVLRLRGRVLHASNFAPVEDFGGRLQSEQLDDGEWVWKNLSTRLRPDRSEPGSFAVTLPGPGRYRALVSHDESLTAYSAPVDFDGRLEPPEVEVTLQPGAVLNLLVEDSRGVPVPGLRVSVVDWDAHEAYEKAKRQRKKNKKLKRPKSSSQRTDSDGFARFRLYEGGRFAIQLPQLEDEFGAAFFVWPGPPVQHTLTLGPTGDLLVSVRDETGLPIPGMRVRVRSTDRRNVSRSESVRTAEDEVLLGALLPDSYHLSVEARGFSTHQREVTVLGDMTQRIDIVMQSGRPRAANTTNRLPIHTRGR